MAFIDKVTHMRRCAIINDGNGAIEYEGVWIEGVFLLKEVRYGGIYTIDEKDIFNYFCLDQDYVEKRLLVFMDEKTNDNNMWIPREESNQVEWDENLGQYDYVEDIDG